MNSTGQSTVFFPLDWIFICGVSFLQNWILKCEQNYKADKKGFALKSFNWNTQKKNMNSYLNLKYVRVCYWHQKHAMNGWTPQKILLVSLRQ